MTDIEMRNGVTGIQAMALIVSDDYFDARIWSAVLKEKNIHTAALSFAEDILQAWFDVIPDLIVIDLHNEESEGISIVSKLREQGVVPIMLLTPLNNESHILDAYRAGVDECVVKPVSPAVFLAKVEAWLRRTWSMPAEGLDTVNVGGLQLDPTRRHVIAENEAIVKLTNLEFRLLHLLMSHPGWVFKTEDIVQKVWGYYGNGDSNLLKNVVYRLRRKIDPDPGNPRYIHTEAGIGYRFQDMLN